MWGGEDPGRGQEWEGGKGQGEGLDEELHVQWLGFAWGFLVSGFGMSRAWMGKLEAMFVWKETRMQAEVALVL